MARTKFSELAQEFSQRTSCHGLAEVNASSHKLQKIIWIFLIVGVVAALVVQLGIRITEYSEHKTTTSVSEKYEESLDLPAITFCNFNSFFGIESEEEKDAISELATARNYVEGVPINTDKFKYFENVFNGSVRAYATRKGWDLNNSLALCYAGNEICTTENFTFSLGDMGKCWTYKQSKKIKRAGSRHGVSMALDVHQDEYTESFVNGRWQAGIRVQVHPTYDVPEVDQFGMAIPVGSMAFISLHKREENIMYKPWGDCEQNKESLILHDTYSEPNCFHDCFQRKAEESCQCQMYYDNSSSQFPECTPREMVDCFVNVTADLKLSLTPKKCDCSPPCKSQHFDSKISYATFPNLAVQRELLQVANLSEEYTKRNLVALTVYYERMSYSLREESKATTWTALISDLGGQLGLWIGISVVTLCEFIQFVITACVDRMSSNKKSNEQKKDRTRQRMTVDNGRENIFVTKQSSTMAA